MKTTTSSGPIACSIIRWITFLLIPFFALPLWSQTITTQVVDIGASTTGQTGQHSSMAVISGNPSIAYFNSSKSSLMFARNSAVDGTGSWQITTVDFAGDVGQYTSLKAVDGKPAISYYDVTNQDLKYARNSAADGSGSWTVTSVDTGGDVGQWTTLVVVDGKPAISYYDVTNQDLKYARNSVADGSGTWTITSVDTAGSVGRSASLAVVAGKPAISYGDGSNGDIKYASNSAVDGSGTWTFSVVHDSTIYSAPYTSLAEVNGKPAISYEDGFARNLIYARNSAADGSGTWTRTTVGGWGRYTSLAVVDGKPAISYLQVDTNSVYFARNSAADGTGSWSTSSVDSGAGMSTSLAVVDGKPAISYQRGSSSDLKFASNSSVSGSGSWTSVVADAGQQGGIAGTYASQAVIDGKPAISYYDQTNQDLKYARNSAVDGSGTWTLTTVHSVDAVGFFTSLAEINGKPAISYYDLTNGDLKYARNSAADGSGTWTITSVDTSGDVGGYTSLAAVDGKPAISYQDIANGDLKYARNSAADGSGTWTITSVDSVGILGRNTSLVVVDGKPAISYYDQTNGNLKYARNSAADGSGTWTLTNVDTVGDVGPHSSLAVVDGKPAISYQDLTNGDLKYARNSAVDGSGTWTFISIDTVIYVDGYTSLKVVDGKPAISYLDGTNRDLKYARNSTVDGSGLWTLVSVDTAGFVGQFTSLAVIDGQAAISYHDVDNGLLKWARVVEIPANPPTVNTPTSANVAAATATLGGDVTADGEDTITARGVVFAKTSDNADPQLGGANVMVAGTSGTTGVFTVNVTGLIGHTGYTFKAYATNSKGTSYTSMATFTTLNNVPTDIDLSANSLAENNAANATIGTLSATDADAGDMHTFTKATGEGDTDNASFTIDGTALKLIPVADFETKSSYSLRVQADDGNGGMFAKALTVTITNVNEVATDITLNNASVAENAPMFTLIGVFITTDPDAGDNANYNLVGLGNDNDSFFLSGNSLSTFAPLDFETKSSYTVRIRTFSGGLNFDKDFTITVTNLNEAPTDIALSASSIAENNAANATVGTLSSTDSDAGETFTYSFASGGADNGSFTLSSNALNLVPKADFETKSSYAVKIRSTDAGGLFFDKDFTINITNMNEVPSFTKGTNPSRPFGTSTAQSLSGWATGIDDGDSTVVQALTFTISSNTNAALFTALPAIAADGTLIFTPTGTPGTATLGVILTDDASINGNTALTTAEQTFTITVAANTPPIIAASGGGGAPVFTSLLSFTGNSGANPGRKPSLSSLVQGSDGDFYGMTFQGGASDLGTVFKMTPAGVRTTLVEFTGTSGANPGSNAEGSLVESSDGDFYGMTNRGGTSNLGTVFKMTSAGVRTTLVNFTGTSGANPGSSPLGSLVQGSDGDFYGMTYGGGTSNLGTVFKMTPAGVFTTLLDFTGISGANPGSQPNGNLVQGSDGDFYGMTSSGGTGNLGTVFKMTSAGTRTTLVNFTGTTGANAGSSPFGSLVQGSDGAFYGMTSSGGTSNLGTVFKMDSAGVLTTLVNFTGTSGANPGTDPEGSLVQGSDGDFYGMTSAGGTSNLGTIFKMTSAGTRTTLVNFTGISGANPGRNPFGNLIQGSDGFFYGMTNLGGTNNLGTVFKLDAPTLTTSAAEGSLATQTGTFSDADGNATVTLSASSGTVTQDNVAGTWSWSATGTDGPATSTVTITATDTASATATAAFTFAVTNVAPTFDLGSNVTLAMGSGVLSQTVSFTDPGADTWSGTVDYGDGSGSQALSVNAGAKTFALSHTYTMFDSFTVSVTLNDDDGGSTTDTYTLNAQPNRAPTDIALSSSSIAENNAANATVGTLSATDADVTDTHTFTKVSGAGDTDNDSFTIDGTALKLIPVADFETQSSYSVRVQTDDGNGGTFAKVFTITISDGNDAATVIALTPASIAEINAPNATVGTLSATDANVGDTHTFTKVSGAGDTDNASFTIDGSSVKLIPVADFETQSIYSLRVQADDGNGGVFAQALTITITDVTEGVYKPLTVSVMPSSAAGAVTFSPRLSSTGMAVVGRTYTVTANAKTGWFFDSWGGKAAGTSVSTTFTFAEGDTVVANFTGSPFTSDVAGKYNGAVAGTSAEASGLFIATLSQTTGAITARLSRLGTYVAFAGELDFRTLQFTSPAVTDGHVASLTLNPTTKHLSGTITEMIGGVAGTVHVIDASKTYDRSTPPTTGVGVYNAAFSAPTSLGTLTAAQHPQGIGYGVLSIGATGTVTVTGLLADGTAWSSSTSLGIDQSISLYGVLRISRSTPVFGALVGTATLDTSAVATDLTGSGIKWFSSAHSSQYYPAGYEGGLSMNLVGAQRSTSTRAALGLSSTPTVVFSGGPFASPLSVSLNGTTLLSTDKLTKLTFSAKGLMTGEYKADKTAVKHSIRGIIVGKGGSAEAYGYILSPLPAVIDGTGLGGLVELNP